VRVACLCARFFASAALSRYMSERGDMQGKY
jgi:hypothetical protein